MIIIKKRKGHNYGTVLYDDNLPPETKRKWKELIDTYIQKYDYDKIKGYFCEWDYTNPVSEPKKKSHLPDWL